MELRPILSTLRRHKTASALIVLEIALSCAIICNAMFLIGGRLERMDRPTGQAEDEIVRVQITGIGQDDNAAALTQSDLAVLRALPGVKSASTANQITFGGSSWNSGVQLDPDQTQITLSATTYLGDEKLPETLGLKLVAGRFFNADELVDWEAFQAPGANLAVPVAIITKDVAEKLWPGQDPLGKTFYSWGEGGTRVVGVVDKLARPNGQGGPDAYYYSTILPLRIPFNVGGNYLLRTSPERRAEVLKAAVEALEKNGPNRIILEQQTLEEMRSEFYRQDREAFVGRRRRAGLDVVQREQRFQRGGDGRVVVDDEDGGHARSLSGRARVRAYTLRVATAGGTAAARRAGPRTESWPSSHSTTAPTGR